MSGWFLTVSALADLQDIISYGRDTWGERQARRYAEDLYELFGDIVLSPGIGRQRPELRQSLQSLPHTSHVVFYMVWNDRVVVARVLHGAMDFDGLFEGYDPMADLPG